MDAVCLHSSICGIPHPSIPITITATVRPHDYAVGRASLFSGYPLKSFWPRSTGNASFGYHGLAVNDVVSAEDSTSFTEQREAEGVDEEGQNRNWVFKIWSGKHRTDVEGQALSNHQTEEECDGCRADYDEDNEEDLFDRDTFSRMLRRVSLAEARLYARISHLANMSYSIPKIKPGKLFKHYGLRFVTSSIEKRLAVAAEKNQTRKNAATQKEETNENDVDVEEEAKVKKNGGYMRSASAAYEMAASAASYLHAQTKSILPFKSSEAVEGEGSLESSNKSFRGDYKMTNKEEAALKATTDSVTAVVSANEQVKQAFADDLNSTTSSPCEWFICDDDKTSTRYFVIQGSESFASWQANLLFEPVKFEGLDVHVHRGIYEAAKGTYQHMLPEIRAHLKSHGSQANFRFTGHSLGGSLALLVNLMLLIRKEAPRSFLLPVITFGAPSIMCGGDSLLDMLGLPRSHVQSITMHRDIVPRAFSCQYPNHVAELLKALSANFRNHPCLNNQKLLYAPMGELLILQPDENFSPSHHLLPSGSGLYLLSGSLLESSNKLKRIHKAQMVFLNTPHPLEILSDRSAYGSGGTIQRDHDMNSYLKCVRTVIHQELNQIRKTRREQRRKAWWSLVLSRNTRDHIVVGGSMIHEEPSFSDIVQIGRESLNRFTRLLASQHMQFFVVLLFPARMLLMGACNLISLR